LRRPSPKSSLSHQKRSTPSQEEALKLRTRSLRTKLTKRLRKMKEMLLKKLLPPSSKRTKLLLLLRLPKLNSRNRERLRLLPQKLLIEPLNLLPQMQLKHPRKQQ